MGPTESQRYSLHCEYMVTTCCCVEHMLHVLTFEVVTQDSEKKPGQALLSKGMRSLTDGREMSSYAVCRAHQLFAGAALLQRWGSPEAAIAVQMCLHGLDGYAGACRPLAESLCHWTHSHALISAAWK